MAIVLKATWTANEGAEQTVLDALEQLSPLSRAEPGCRFYQAYRDPAEPRVFHIFEIYDDEAAVEAHGASEHFRSSTPSGRRSPPSTPGSGTFFETIDA